MWVIEINEIKQPQTFSVCEMLRILSSVEETGNCTMASYGHVNVNDIQEWRNRKIIFYTVVFTSMLFIIK
jgi:hypothetical protein